MIRPTSFATFVLAVLVSLAPCAFPQTSCEAGAAPLKRDHPAQLKSQEIIQKFAAHESATQAARLRYSFTQDVTIQTLNRGTMPNDWSVDGEYRSVIDVSHDPHGRRLEAVRFAPQSTLRDTSLTPEDYEDINHFSIFMLTTDELPRYNVNYLGQQHVDELETYVFEVAPKSIDKGKRYFQGKVWVEATDLQVVKTCGKSVPNVPITQKKRFIGKKVVGQGVQPTFATYREFIDGKYWFPTYSRSDDVLTFGRNEVKLKERILFKDYKSLASGQPMNSKALTDKRHFMPE